MKTRIVKLENVDAEVEIERRGGSIFLSFRIGGTATVSLLISPDDAANLAVNLAAIVGTAGGGPP